MNERDADIVLNKIAELVQFGATNGEIAEATGLNGEEIAQVRALPAFSELLSSLQMGKFDSIKTMNDGWDAIEQRGLTAVLEHMAWSKDPEFALKAATIANKSLRRGIKTNQPLQGSMDTRSVIHLNQTFIENMQQNNHTAMPAVVKSIEIDQKTEDFMNPDALEEMLFPEAKQEAEIAKRFAPLRAMDK